MIIFICLFNLIFIIVCLIAIADKFGTGSCSGMQGSFDNYQVLVFKFLGLWISYSGALI